MKDGRTVIDLILQCFMLKSFIHLEIICVDKSTIIADFNIFSQ